MKKKFITNSILIIALISIIVGCDDEKSIYETGSKVISMITTEASNTIEIIVDPAKQNNVTIQAQIDQPSAFGIVAEVEVATNMVDEYNRQHQTNYLELPPNAYTLGVSEFIFPKYSKESSHISISFTSTGMHDETFYLLPLQITAVRGDNNASINPNSNIIYVVVSKLPPPKLIHLKDIELTTEIGTDKKNWFAAYAKNSAGGHTFSIEEAAQQSHLMDFVLVKHGSNLRLHPSIIGWQHGGDYHKFTEPYTKGFKKLTMIANMNRLFSTSIFNQITTSEDLVNKVAELRQSENYNFYTADRMTSHNLQSQIKDDSRILMQGWGPKIGQNEQFSFLYIKEVASLPNGEYRIKFDIKYIDHDIRNELPNVSGQNVVIDNLGYDPSDEIVEYKNIELTTEIGTGKKNWFSAYADNYSVTFSQEEARGKSEMMDFTPVMHSDTEVRMYTAYVGYEHAGYKERIAPYTQGFSKLTYTMLGGWRAGYPDATKPEHYESVKDIKSLSELIGFYRQGGYSYHVANRMNSDNLSINSVGIFAWGHKVGINNRFGIYIVRDMQPTGNGNYIIKLDIKVPKSDARTPNNGSSINNPD